MKILPAILLISLFAGAASADPPRKTPVSKYAKLWNNSPITDRPPPQPTTPEVEAFADWTLTGVAEVPGGYQVQIMNKKKQGESQIISPGQIQLISPDAIDIAVPGEKGNFKVVSVNLDTTSADDWQTPRWRKTTVTLASGAKTGIVQFEEEFTTPKAGAAPPPQQQQQPNGGAPVQPQANQPGAPANAAPPGGRRNRTPVPAPPANGGQNIRR